MPEGLGVTAAASFLAMKQRVTVSPKETLKVSKETKHIYT